jgi:hypothetical protein
MSEKTVLAAMALVPPAVVLLVVVARGRRERFQFSLTTILLLIIPLAAVIAWVASGEGSFVSERRVLTYKTGMVQTALNAAAVIGMWRRGWFRWQAALVFVTSFAVLFAWLAWKQHEESIVKTQPGTVRLWNDSDAERGEHVPRSRKGTLSGTESGTGVPDLQLHC